MWPWLVAAVIVIALCVGAWVGGNWLAKDLLQQAIRGEVIDTLDLPSDQDMTVEVAGFVIPQLVFGTLDDVSISANDVVFDELVGDVRVQAQGIPLRSEDPIDSIRGEVVLTESQLRAVLATVDGFPAGTVALDAPDVSVSVELSAFGNTVPIGIALTPSALDGAIELAPASLVVGDAVMTAEDIRERFGGLADPVLRSWTVCIAQWMPAGVVLTDLDVLARGTGDTVVAAFDVDGRIAHDESLQEHGVCA